MSFTLKEMLEDNGFNVRSYSGRGMHGSECLAITSDDSIIKTIASITEIAYESLNDEAFSDFLATLSSARQDNMGMGIVLYFPDIEYSQDEESDDESEDEEFLDAE